MDISGPKPIVSVIIPARNEGLHIGGVLSEMPKNNYEAIVVDDGSDDDTVEVARGYNVKILLNARTLGKAATLKRGLGVASGDVIVFIDGDGQHDSSKIPELIKPIIEGSTSVVFGNRFHKGYAGTPYIRIISNYLSRLAINFITGRDIPDPLCGFRAFRKEKIRGMDFGKGYGVEINVLFNLIENDEPIINAPVPLIYESNESSIKFFDNVKLVLLMVYRISRYVCRKIWR